MAAYSLLATVSTVQVISPTIVNDVVYCTIQTNPSSVIASIPINTADFNSNLGVQGLTAFADNIETLIGRGHIVAGTGVQTIDANGLLQDQVSFTVQYVPPNVSGTSITAEALVPVGLLSQSDPAIESTLLAEAQAIIDGVYSALHNAQGG